MTTTGAHVLPCERRVEDLWDHLDRVSDEHERHCPHCQAGKASLLALAEATRAALQDESLTPPPGLHAKIMSVVRAEVRRGQRIPLPPGDLGPVDVSEQAVAVVLRYAADTVPGVRARRCRLLVAENVPDSPGGVRVDLSIAVAYHPGTTVAVAQAVRDRVITAASAQVGLDVRSVDIEIEDVYLDGG